MAITLKSLPKWVESTPDSEGLILSALCSMTLVKLQECKRGIEIYESKYGIPFEKFQERVNDSTRKEIFEEWDDYLEWKAYWSGYQEWQEKYNEISRCTK